LNNILEYFEKVQNIVEALSKVEIERYDEEIFSEGRGNIKFRIRFHDNSLLEVSEAIYFDSEKFLWLSYRYHYQKPDGSVIFRYDNTPHYPHVDTYPDHKHVGSSVVGSLRPDIENVFSEIKEHLEPSRK
jgi:hypothetical protein